MAMLAAGHMVTHMRLPSRVVQYPLELEAVAVAAVVELVVLVFMASSFGELPLFNTIPLQPSDSEPTLSARVAFFSYNYSISI